MFIVNWQKLFAYFTSHSMHPAFVLREEEQGMGVGVEPPTKGGAGKEERDLFQGDCSFNVEIFNEKKSL